MTPELARQILELHQTSEMTQQEIAFQLGVNQGRVNEVIKRGKWLGGDPNAPEAVARDKALARAARGSRQNRAAQAPVRATMGRSRSRGRLQAQLTFGGF